MTLAYDQANPFQRTVRRLVASGPGAWVFARLLDHLDRPVYRLTRGKHTFASLASGLPVVMLTTTGARSARGSDLCPRIVSTVRVGEVVSRGPVPVNCAFH